MDFNKLLFQLNQDNILNAVSNDFSVRQVTFSNHFDQMSLYLSISFTERFFSPRQDPPCPACTLCVISVGRREVQDCTVHRFSVLYDCNTLMFSIVRNVKNFRTLGLSFEGVL